MDRRTNQSNASSALLRTRRRTFFLYAGHRGQGSRKTQEEKNRDSLSGSVRTSLAASMLAGLSKFGVSDDKREMTLTSWKGAVSMRLVWQVFRFTIDSTVWTGIHLSPASS
jgi:hypothetical protein